MSLLIALPLGVASAVAYGASTAVEHAAVHSDSGELDTGGLLRLVRNPRWLLGMAGDTLGLVLQVLALATGPVVLIQPLLILALPISLPIARLLGGPKPGRSQYLSCLWIIAGLAAFFVIIGNPGDADPLSVGPAVVGTLIIAAIGIVGLAAVRRGASTLKAAIYGGVAGAWFGLVAVLLDAVAATWQQDGIDGFGHAGGLVPLIALLILGGASIALTQVAFQIGELAASFPANLAADPVIAVVLGAVLLHERVPATPWAIVGYLVCLGAILFGAVRLAADPTRERVPA
jgi:drug/metabolite transporter (DMT)-like permease